MLGDPEQVPSPLWASVSLPQPHQFSPWFPAHWPLTPAGQGPFLGLWGHGGPQSRPWTCWLGWWGQEIWALPQILVNSDKMLPPSGPQFPLL